MATEVKLKKVWEGEAQETSEFNETASVPFQKQLIGYTFLKNLWGTYFFDKQELTSEDKIDNMNKIVGMMKAQIKIMTISQNKQIGDRQGMASDFIKYSEAYNSLQTQLNQMRQKLDRSQLKEKQLNDQIDRQNQKVLMLQQENGSLRNQVQELKQAKNRANQQIISLSNRCYELERLQQAPTSASLDQFSAITVQRDQESQDRPRVSFFGRKDSKMLQNLCDDNASMRSCEETSGQKEEINEITLNLPIKNRDPMKQSLQCNYEQEKDLESYGSFMRQMKLIKLRTKRIIGAENDKFCQRQHYRKTIQSHTSRPQLKEVKTPIDNLKEKRFRRIR